MKHITPALFPNATKLFARFIYMCMLPFTIVEKVYFKNWLVEGMGVLFQFPVASKSRNSGGSVCFQYQVSRVIHLPGWGANTLIFKNTNTRKYPKPFLGPAGIWNR